VSGPHGEERALGASRTMEPVAVLRDARNSALLRMRAVFARLVGFAHPPLSISG
jgi:hypothetical protein